MTEYHINKPDRLQRYRQIAERLMHKNRKIDGRGSLAAPAEPVNRSTAAVLAWNRMTPAGELPLV